MAADKDALNYPYIRVRSVDWLKRTLLIFPHVLRMTPNWGAPADDPEIRAFMDIEGRRGPLLHGARLNSDHVHKAQSALVHDLAARIEAEGPAFQARFGREATKFRSADLPSGSDVWDRRFLNKTFQIHTYKLIHPLTQFLTRQGLAWKPAPELADGTNYVEMHPALGEAVMATLAMACAENEGLQVITEFPQLHGKLLGVPREKILDASFDNHGPSGATSGQQIAEFLVYHHCDVDLLSAEAIADLQDERQALADFRTKIDELAGDLPETIVSQERLEEYLRASVSDLLDQWRGEQVNFGPKARRLFIEGVRSAPKAAAEKWVEATVSGAPPGDMFTAIALGTAVKVVFHGVGSWFKARREAKNGPLRYLTKLQDHGVSYAVAP